MGGPTQPENVDMRADHPVAYKPHHHLPYSKTVLAHQRTLGAVATPLRALCACGWGTHRFRGATQWRRNPMNFVGKPVPLTGLMLTGASCMIRVANTLTLVPRRVEVGR